jgi:alcohol dehydrogenase
MAAANVYGCTPCMSYRKLPEVTFEQGAWFGYLGTSFAALRRGGAGREADLPFMVSRASLGARRSSVGARYGVLRIPGWGCNREARHPAQDDCSPSGQHARASDEPLRDWVRARTEERVLTS